MAKTKLTDLPEVLVADNAMEIMVEDAGTVKKITRANFVDGLASAGTTTAGGTSAGGGVGAGGAVELIASGSLVAGEPVLLNPDGTVTSVGTTTLSAAMQFTNIQSIPLNGTNPTGSKTKIHTSLYDADRNQSVVLYTFGSSLDERVKDATVPTSVRCLIGHTVSTADDFQVDHDGEFVSSGFLWGVNFENYGHISACIAGDKLLVWYDHENGAQFIVGTLVSGGVSWGVSQTFNNGYHATFYESAAFYDAVNDKVVISFGSYGASLNGFSQYASGLTPPIDPHDVDYIYRDAGGQRKIGIYTFDGTDLVVEGSLHNVTPSDDGFLNCSGCHAYAPSGTVVDWLASPLSFALDIYYFDVDGAYCLGYLNTSGQRVWSTIQYGGGGWWTTQRMSRLKVTSAWAKSSCSVLKSYVAFQTVSGTYPAELKRGGVLKLLPIRQDTEGQAPTFGSATDNINISTVNSNTGGYSYPNDVNMVYSNYHQVFAYGQASADHGTLSVRAFHLHGSENHVTVQTFGGGGNSSTNTFSPGVTARSNSGHEVVHVNKTIWFFSNGGEIRVMIYDPGSDLIVSNLGDMPFVGFAANNHADGESALILTVGSIETTRTGLVPGTKMWVRGDGSLQSSADEYAVFAGTALTSNKLLVRF